MKYPLSIRDNSTSIQIYAKAFADELEIRGLELVSILKNGDITQLVKERAKDRFIRFLISGLELLGFKYVQAVGISAAIVHNVSLMSVNQVGRDVVLRYLREKAWELYDLVDGTPETDIIQTFQERWDEEHGKILAIALASAGVAAYFASKGMDAREIYSVLDGSVGDRISDAMAILNAVPTKKFVYVHTMYMEGICSRCLPFVGKICDGTGRDGVPVPPQHQRCKCALVPYIEGEEREDVDVIRTLRKIASGRNGARNLAKIIGPVRANLVASGKLTLEQLFDSNLTRLLSLEELGYTTKGNVKK